jgi:hypothetical protein
MSQFKYRADRIPVFIIISLFALDVLAYLLIDNVWLLIAYWLIMIAPNYRQGRHQNCGYCITF